ncbi:putative T7SS-secreted protein, partial [Streptomyces smaragdinus]|uniref:putative T7SS-secreted protein n=1 Tax=Streptomyces smaragdinus TaxID=2585196 RepID=UPI002B1F6710
MGIGDFIPDSLEDAAESTTEWLGDRIEDGGDIVADGLDDMGWQSGADWVRENSRALANQMGAQVDELQLGQTKDPKQLIHGNAEKLRTHATNLRDMAQSFSNVAQGLKGLDSSHIKGRAADAFRDSVSIEPPKWLKGADAFLKAAGALEQFAGTVLWAQGRAQVALDTFERGMRASDAYEEKRTAYNDAVDRYNKQPEESRDPASLPARPSAVNPGIALMNEAQEILTEARKQRNTAAESAASAVDAAASTAPPKPDYGEQVKDGMMEIPSQYLHLNAGAVKGITGITTFVRMINPTDPYNITHPAEYATSLNSTVTGMLRAANDPWGTGRQMVTDFMKDPAEGFGRLIPDIALTIATDGAGAGVRVVRLADDVSDAAKDANRARRAVDDLPGGHNKPDRRRVCNGTDPVDLATGRMFLPQTDVSLPGALPLEFTRRVESGYGLGRFFGPSWSSVVDERLLVDAHGVVHVTADGLLVTYPHPVPGTPTGPETGAWRTVLERDAIGDYRLTDRDTGLVTYFPGPDGGDPGSDGAAWLAEKADRNGHRITIDRDPEGTPLALVHSGGYHLRLTTSNGLITALDLGTTPVMRYGYTGGNLTAVIRPSGATTTFVYDDERRITAWTDSNRRRYDYVYDDRHRVIAEGGEAGHFQITLRYGDPDPDTGERVTELTTAAGHTTRHRVDSRCNVLATTDPLGHTTSYTYDPAGRPLTRTDPLGHTTSYTYDDGLLTGVLRPDGTRTSTRYDALGCPVELTGPDGAVRRQEFDERGNLLRHTDPAGHTTVFTYDAHGHPASVADPLDAVTLLRCDAAGLPAGFTDPCGGEGSTMRDAFGRPTLITGPDGGITALEWTADGYPARRTAPDGSAERWTWDGEGNCTAYTGATGATTLFEYGHFDQLTARTESDGARYEFDHDAELRLTRVTNPQGLTWTYEHDAAGRTIAETDFDGRGFRYEPDAAGRLVTRTTPLGDTIGFTYDELGRTIRKDAAGAVTTYSYDPAGRLIHAGGPDGELIRQYDRRGLLKTELSGGHAMTHAWNAAGRRTRRTTPSGHVTTYTYDPAGRPATVTTGDRELRYTRDLSGREVTRDWDGVITQRSVWDIAGRLTEQHLTAGARAVNRRDYTYRPDGHLAAVGDTLRGLQRFDLDSAGRVTAVTADRWTERYAYDTAGNQTAAAWQGHPGGAEDQGARAYTATRIERAGANRYTHDAAGRLITRTRTRLSRKPDAWHFRYTADDRLREVTTPDGTRWRYTYDPLGRRTSKQRLAGDGTVAERTDFAWDGRTLCEQTTAGLATTWDHQGHTPVAQTERRQGTDARFFAIATDLIGTPTELIDEAGTIAWRTRSTLWGTTTWHRSATAYTPLRHPGQYYDPETGLHYNHHRYYDPTTARYTTPDPLGLA